MNVVVIAQGDLGCEGLRALIRSSFTVQAVFTPRDLIATDRGPGSLEEIAAEHGLPLFAPEEIDHPLWVARIAALEPDMMFVFDVPRPFGQALVSLPKKGGFRLHGALLPRYKAPTPVHRALLQGETTIGATLYTLESAPYQGDIAAQCSVEAEPSDSAAAITARLQASAGGMLDRILPDILAGRCELVPQDLEPSAEFGEISANEREIRWDLPAEEVFNCVRACGLPLAGATTTHRQSRFVVWKARPRALEDDERLGPGRVVSTSPLVVACGEDGLEILLGQEEGGLALAGAGLADSLNLTTGDLLEPAAAGRRQAVRPTRVLILGINGFIGNALTERLLQEDNYEIHGLDINADAIRRFIGRKNFFFHEGDISINREWIEYHVKKCDVILPLVAIATPIEYTRNPLRVFELDFEENLKVVRDCVTYGKRVVFPSTSEVYGMSESEIFDEEHSNLVLGPIRKQRWIYSCSKQLLDRVIWAYGATQGLRFTLFRPFNWLGPRLDTLDSAREGNSRVVTQLILNLVEGKPILLIDGGLQKRCFTDVRDGVECLYRIIENDGGGCDGKIINVGNPDNELSVKELAELLLRLFDAHPLRRHFPAFAGFRAIESRAYYGPGYQDVQRRRPSIENARRYVNWRPQIATEEALSTTLDYFLRDYLSNAGTDTPASEVGS